MRVNELRGVLSAAKFTARNEGVKPVVSAAGLRVSNFLSEVFTPLGRARAGHAITSLRLNPPPSDLDCLIDWTSKFKAVGIRIDPQQSHEEILSLLKLVASLKPRALLEIGSYLGGTLLLFAAVADTTAKVLSLDLYRNATWKFPFYKSFAREAQSVELIPANSHDSKAREEVLDILSGDLLDFLFIDGDHSYQGVKRDFEMYGNLVRDGGLIAFHDIVFSPYPGNEVNKFWNRIKNSYKFEEIVKRTSLEGRTQISGGIGILYV